jgi:(p)ppGpp synthase/HD superfamily hydrolase
MTTTLADLTAAYDFAARVHANQRRLGQAAEPYVNHLIEVADLIAGTGINDIELLMAAVLHDAVEDTPTTAAELKHRFGERIACLVLEVTDDKELPKAERKRLEIVRAANASAGAKIIKIADKTSNLRSLATSPPVNWSGRRRRAYVEWARQVIAGCRGLNADLEEQFHLAAQLARGASS